MEALKFVPFTSAADASFWQALSTRKVDSVQLSEEPQSIWGSYSSSRIADQAPLFSVSGDSFETKLKPVNTNANANSSVSMSMSMSSNRVPGTLHLVNTMDAFKNMDRTSLFKACAAQIWDDIHSGKALDDPALLSRFMIVAFADLKKFKFFYWFAFPALTIEPLASVQFHTTDVDDFIKKERDELHEYMASTGQIACLLDPIRPISLSELKLKDNSTSSLKLAIIDPSGKEKYPGWPVRNLLSAIRVCCPELQSVDLYCVRTTASSSCKDVVFGVKFEPLKTSKDAAVVPNAVGWEKNSQGKLAPRSIDLAAMMDPAKLAETGVDLNLKLMRWRLLPSLDLERLSSTRVLLVGAGTVGCAVARVLMGWGIRQITFIDNGKVSYSNPVRQSLYEFEDCVGGGSLKAPTAAKRLGSIFPGSRAEGHVFQIPMPGHSLDVDNVKLVHKTREDVERLTSLISDHDVIYLTTDSRESRWLPTLLCAESDTLCINVALGFDSFVVMRHGHRGKGADDTETETETKGRLGCYFCNDVVAPANSQTDRTLDQQCTVTRPGVAYVASSLAVELMVSILHHPLQNRAPAEGEGESETDSPLGLVPHQIRGFLAQFNNLLITGQAYKQCTACSEIVVNAFRKEGFKFLLRVFNEGDYLENITGLTELHRKTEEITEDIDFDWGSEDGEL